MIQKHLKLNPNNIFWDRDGDGITDSIDFQLLLSPSCSHPTVLSAVMDLSACLGFETMGMNLPLVQGNERRDNSFSHYLYIGMDDELKGIYSKKKEGDYFLGGGDKIELAKSIKDFAFSLISKKVASQKRSLIKRDGRREGFDLLNPFSIQGFYCGSPKMPLPIFFPYKILLFSHFGLSTAIEASHFAARLGLETLSLSLPLTFPLERRTRGIKNFIYIGKKEDLSEVESVRNIDIFESNWNSGIFLLPSKKRIPDVLICGEEKGLRKILKNLSLITMNSRGVDDPIFNTIKIFLEELRKFILRKEPSKETISPEKIVKDYIIPDEKEEIIRLLIERLKNRRTKPNSVEVQVFIARPEKERKEFEEKIKRELKGLGFNIKEMDITVLNAYKPGLSWMREVVVKEISRMKVDRVEITFKELRNKGLEESIRWLQEIYPIDEIFARELSIPKEKIKFKKDSRIKEVYRVRAWHGKKLIYENQFSPQWIEQPYLISFPRLGKVHPTTGWVKVNVDGEEVINQRIKTGIERIWEIYQAEILSLIEKEANKALSIRRLFSSQPIFDELRFDIHFDYPNELLGMGEERISPLEALHEDLYFVTLDFFSKWLRKKGIKGVSMGRVLPIIHPNFRGRKGKMRFRLVHRSIENFSISRSINDVKISINGIVFNGSKVGIDLFVGGEKEDGDGLKKRIKSYCSLNDGVFKIKKFFEENHSNKKGLRLIAFGSDFPRGKRSFYRNQKRRPIEIPMDRPIGYREGMRLIKSLEGLSGINVIEEGCSSGGLPIFSIENTYPCPSTFISHAKKALFRPTFFINCRHHANEISSTNAGLRLSYLLAAQPEFRRLLRKVNIVINPMENVDGVAILEGMLKLTPTDKLHAGRYNKAGQEYYAEYFNPKTLFGEAKVKPAIWKRWLPDICVDNHGFPSHEWEQPFSGYAPFRFREFWIPRALFYFYLPHLEEKPNSFHRMNSEVLKKWIDKAFSKNLDILKWNRIFLERYWKYRHQWLQKGSWFNRDIQCLPLQKRFQRTNYSYCYPHITSVDFITEVADETAHGKFLKTCVSAHLQSNLAIIKLLNYLDFNVKKIYSCGGKQVHFMWYRKRPLVFKTLRKEGKKERFRIQEAEWR